MTAEEAEKRGQHYIFISDGYRLNRELFLQLSLQAAAIACRKRFFGTKIPWQDRQKRRVRS
jgi:hypothetical protein